MSTPSRCSASARQQEAQLLSSRACNSSPHECFELGVGSSARATRLPMATVFQKTGPSANSKEKPGSHGSSPGLLVQRQSRRARHFGNSAEATFRTLCIIRSPRDTGKCGMGTSRRRGVALPDPAACGRAPRQTGCHPCDCGDGGPDQAPRSAVERDDFDLNQRRGRKSAKNEYNLKLPKFNRSREAWRIAGAYIGRGTNIRAPWH
jgi:hypothetical protein